MVLTDAMVQDAKALFDALIKDRERLIFRLHEAESVIHEIGELSGFLDIVSGTNECLMHAIREAHDRLDKMASSYWYVLGKEEVPL